MSTVQLKTREQIESEIRREHSDWSEQKIKMQVGRQLKLQETKAKEVERRSKIAEQVRNENPGLDEKAVEKEVSLRIKREEEHARLANAAKSVEDARKSYEAALYNYAKIKILSESKSGSKQSIPKEVIDAAKKLKEYADL